MCYAESLVEELWWLYVSTGMVALTHKEGVVNPEDKQTYPLGIYQLVFFQGSPCEGFETMILGATAPHLTVSLT